MKEYFAVGRPVVTTEFPALDGWRDLVRIADGAESFASQIRSAIDTPYDPSAARARVSGETWDAKTQAILDSIGSLGLISTSSAAPVARGCEQRILEIAG
jgi:hypothetical protein